MNSMRIRVQLELNSIFRIRIKESDYIRANCQLGLAIATQHLHSVKLSKLHSKIVDLSHKVDLIICRPIANFTYSVTHHVVLLVPLISNQKMCFSIRSIY